MVAIDGHPIYVYTTDQPGAYVGTITLQGLDRPWSSSDKCLRLRVQYQPATSGRQAETLVQWSAVVDSASDRRIFGRLVEDATHGAGILAGTRDVSTVWLWYVTDDDIEEIEHERALRDMSGPVLFGVHVAGIAVDAGSTFGFSGDGQFTISPADWLSLREGLGYATPASVEQLISGSLTGTPIWKKVVDELAPARRLLELGEDRAALQVCYNLFDAIARNPYRATAWQSVLATTTLPAESGNVIAELLASHTQAINKLARHPSDQADGANGRDMLPMDHWEAELLSILSHLLLAGARRWLAQATPE